MFSITEKLKNELEELGCKVKVLNNINSDNYDPFLHFDKNIMEIELDGYTYSIDTYGEHDIKVYKTDENELVFDGKVRGSGLPFDYEKGTNEDVYKMLDNGYEIRVNNWYSIYRTDKIYNDTEIDITENTTGEEILEYLDMVH